MTELNKERGGGRGRTTSILNVRLPHEEYQAFVDEAGSEYGGRSELFRVIWAFWRQGNEIRALQARVKLQTQRANLAERKLAEIVKLIHQ